MSDPHTKPCSVCRYEIPTDAIVCQKCGHYQKWWRALSNLPTLLSFVLVFVALAQVIVAGVQLEEASSANRRAHEALT